MVFVWYPAILFYWMFYDHFSARSLLAKLGRVISREGFSQTRKSLMTRHIADRTRQSRPRPPRHQVGWDIPLHFDTNPESLRPFVPEIWWPFGDLDTLKIFVRQNYLKSVEKWQGKGSNPRASRSLTDDEVEMLFTKGQFGIHSPTSLLNTIWWNNTTHLGMRGGKEHYDLRWGDVQLKPNSTEGQYLEYTERQTKTRHDDTPRNVRSLKPTMWATARSTSTPDYPDPRDPQVVYKLYRDQRPHQMNVPTAPFYLGINHEKSGMSSKCWFKTQPTCMGVNTLGSLMKPMCAHTGIEGNVTNHSVRKTLIQKLKYENIPDTDIVKITDH